MTWLEFGSGVVSGIVAIGIWGPDQGEYKTVVFIAWITAALLFGVVAMFTHQFVESPDDDDDDDDWDDDDDDDDDDENDDYIERLS